MVKFLSISLPLGYLSISLPGGYLSISLPLGYLSISLPLGYLSISLPVGYLSISLLVCYISVHQSNLFFIELRTPHVCHSLSNILGAANSCLHPVCMLPATCTRPVC